ncbi:ABC transporter ATP-binding protein [Roseomonas sp. CCTCC AB2023176]|uniref:ABC transporter ATP-binding protein n=1 Tax=Roseomonas sp. CCTCC AB2023176 TaxID=3342640 RepID=UPI0035D73702
MLSCEALRKSYGGLEVTRDVTLHVGRGERHAIIGPNGAGKTTLFNLICGEVMPDGGTVSLDGEPITRQSPDARARRGLARSFQRNSTFPGMTVAQTLAVSATVASGRGWNMLRPLARLSDVHERVRRAAEAVGVADLLHVPDAALSHGTRRQVEIGVALASEPRLLMLDEPTAGMSPEETARISRLVASLPRSLTLVIIEHDMELVFGIADRVTVLDAGSILAQGTPEEIRSSALVQARYLGGIDP